MAQGGYSRIKMQMLLVISWCQPHGRVSD